jgi:hypothetical protein
MNVVPLSFANATRCGSLAQNRPLPQIAARRRVRDDARVRLFLIQGALAFLVLLVLMATVFKIQAAKDTLVFGKRLMFGWAITMVLLALLQLWRTGL